MPQIQFPSYGSALNGRMTPNRAVNHVIDIGCISENATLRQCYAVLPDQ